MNLLVIDREKMNVKQVSGFAAADRIAAEDGLGSECIEHCIEEYGRCDGERFTIIPTEWEGE
jgi:hypothetical protein